MVGDGVVLDAAVWVKFDFADRVPEAHRTKLQGTEGLKDGSLVYEVIIIIAQQDIRYVYRNTGLCHITTTSLYLGPHCRESCRGLRR